MITKLTTKQQSLYQGLKFVSLLSLILYYVLTIPYYVPVASNSDFLVLSSPGWASQAGCGCRCCLTGPDLQGVFPGDAARAIAGPSFTVRLCLVPHKLSVALALHNQMCFDCDLGTYFQMWHFFLNVPSLSTTWSLPTFKLFLLSGTWSVCIKSKTFRWFASLKWQLCFLSSTIKTLITEGISSSGFEPGRMTMNRDGVSGRLA